MVALSIWMGLNIIISSTNPRQSGMINGYSESLITTDLYICADFQLWKIIPQLSFAFEALRLVFRVLIVIQLNFFEPSRFSLKVSIHASQVIFYAHTELLSFSSINFTDKPHGSWSQSEANCMKNQFCSDFMKSRTHDFLQKMQIILFFQNKSQNQVWNVLHLKSEVFSLAYLQTSLSFFALSNLTLFGMVCTKKQKVPFQSEVPQQLQILDKNLGTNFIPVSRQAIFDFSEYFHRYQAIYFQIRPCFLLFKMKLISRSQLTYIFFITSFFTNFRFVICIIFPISFNTLVHLNFFIINHKLITPIINKISLFRTKKMDPQQDNQSEKKLGDLRKQITPGNDDENSFEELYSDEEDKEPENNQYKSLPTKSMKNNQMEQEELWDDTPDREHGQSMVLEALPSQLAEQKGIQGEKQKQQQNKEGNQNQWDMQGNEKKQEQNKRQSTRGRQGRENTKKQRASQQQNSELKSVSTPYDSKFVYAAFYLLRQELTEIAKNYKSFVRFNPYVSSKIIKVCAQDQKTCEQVAGKIDDCINDVQVIQMGKFEAESGIQLSYKYLQQLLKQKITIFKDNTQNYKSTSYYICGKVSNKVLYQKLSQIKNTHFSWVHMFRFQNTRSYRAILRKIFQTPEIHEFAMEKFKAREIQVGYLRKDFPFPSKESKRGVLVLLTYHRQKKITIHQQIQQTLSTFIKETFSVFCFIFKRKKQSFVNRYTPKVDKVIMFFIAQKSTNYQTNYLYVIVKNDDFPEMRQKIINEIQNMKLVIRGRRFFKNICPLKETFGNLSKYKEYSFPRNYPYSWSILAKKDSQFDWKEQFKI